MLGPLSDNGGPTLTHALLPGSPAIDTGDPSFVAPPDFDQRGEPFARVHGGRIDIGAYEAQPLHADFDGDHDVDGLDFLALQIGYGTAAPNATKADGDADGDLDVDADDLAIWEAQYGLSEPTELPSLVVTTELDIVDAYDGLTSLREAIAYANGLPGADTVTFTASLTGDTIALASGQLQITEDLTIDGLGANQLTIDGQQLSRVFLIDDDNSGSEIVVTFSGLTITGGKSTAEGGGILSRENLTLEGSVVTQNESGAGFDGGGIWAQGTTTIVNSTISGNSAAHGVDGVYYGPGNASPGTSGGSGGGSFVAGATNITGSTIENNTAGHGGYAWYSPGSGGRGGGIRATGSLIISDSSITGNSTGHGGALGPYGNPAPGGSGGGIYITGSLELTRSTVSGNTTGGGSGARYVGADGGAGGGIHALGTVSIVDSTISGNATGQGGSGGYAEGGAGGGVWLGGAGTRTITNSTISGNSTGRGGGDGRRTYAGDGGDGGGIFADSAVTISHSTITGNTTGANGPHVYGLGYGGGYAGEGGGVFAASTTSLTNSLVALNKQDSILLLDDDLSSPGTFTTAYSLLGVDTGATITDNGGNQIGSSGSPIDPMLDVLADNGGPTFTHALLPGSPAIDMGDPGFIGPPNFDQRGSGFGRVSNGQIDIGAFEVQVFPFPLSQRAVPTSSTAPALSPQLVDLAITANQTKAEGGGRKAEFAEEEYLPASLASAISELDEAPRLATDDIAVSRPGDDDSAAIDASLDEELLAVM